MTTTSSLPLNTLPENSVSVIRGSSKTLELTVVDANEKAVDLTNGKVIMTVKEKAENVAIIFQKSSDVLAQVTLTSPRAGIARIYLVPSDTQNLQIKQYTFDVWVVLSGGRRYPVVPPTVFEVTAGVTLIPLS